MSVSIETKAEQHVSISDSTARELIEMTLSILENLGELDDCELIDELNELRSEFAERNLVK